MSSKIKDLLVDDPIRLTADYSFDNTQRRLVDDQIRGVEQHLVDSLLSGAVCSWFAVDASSSAVAVGSCIVSVGTNVAVVSAGTPNSAALVGIAMSTATAGGKIRVATAGVVPSSTTGLGTTAGFVRANRTTGLCEYVASYATGDISVGSVDSSGALTLGGGAITVTGGSGGGGQTFTFDATGGAVTVGAVLEVSPTNSSQLRKLTARRPFAIATTSASVTGAAITAAVPGQTVSSSVVTAIGAGTDGQAVAVDATGALYRVTNPTGGEILLGYATSGGNLALAPKAETQTAPAHKFLCELYGTMKSGDDTFDNAPAINAAIRAAHTFKGATVEIPYGSYAISGIVVDRQCTLVGQGNGNFYPGTELRVMAGGFGVKVAGPRPGGGYYESDDVTFVPAGDGGACSNVRDFAINRIAHNSATTTGDYEYPIDGGGAHLLQSSTITGATINCTNASFTFTVTGTPSTALYAKANVTITAPAYAAGAHTAGEFREANGGIWLCTVGGTSTDPSGASFPSWSTTAYGATHVDAGGIVTWTMQSEPFTASILTIDTAGTTFTTNRAATFTMTGLIITLHEYLISNVASTTGFKKGQHISVQAAGQPMRLNGTYAQVWSGSPAVAITCPAGSLGGLLAGEAIEIANSTSTQGFPWVETTGYVTKAAKLNAVARAIADGAPTWASLPSTLSVGTLTQPTTPNGSVYIVETGGTKAGSEPTFNASAATVGTTFTDGSGVVWRNLGPCGGFVTDLSGAAFNSLGAGHGLAVIWVPPFFTEVLSSGPRPGLGNCLVVVDNNNNDRSTWPTGIRGYLYPPQYCANTHATAIRGVTIKHAEIGLIIRTKCYVDRLSIQGFWDNCVGILNTSSHDNLPPDNANFAAVTNVFSGGNHFGCITLGEDSNKATYTNLDCTTSSNGGPPGEFAHWNIIDGTLFGCTYITPGLQGGHGILTHHAAGAVSCIVNPYAEGGTHSCYGDNTLVLGGDPSLEGGGKIVGGPNTTRLVIGDDTFTTHRTDFSPIDTGMMDRFRSLWVRKGLGLGDNVRVYPGTTAPTDAMLERASKDLGGDGFLGWIGWAWGAGGTSNFSWAVSTDEETTGPGQFWAPFGLKVGNLACSAAGKTASRWLSTCSGTPTNNPHTTAATWTPGDVALNAAQTDGYAFKVPTLTANAAGNVFRSAGAVGGTQVLNLSTKSTLVATDTEFLCRRIKVTTIGAGALTLPVAAEYYERVIHNATAGSLTVKVSGGAHNVTIAAGRIAIVYSEPGAELQRITADQDPNA